MPPLLASPEPDLDTSRSKSPSFFQRLGSLDLFNNLLFNREKVYQSLKQFSPSRSDAVKAEIPAQIQSFESGEHIVHSIENKEVRENMRTRAGTVVSCSKSTDISVNEPRWRPRKKASATAKPKGRVGMATAKKRAPPAGTKTERASKVQKRIPKANSKKRVNGRGASVTDAFVISDSEDADLDLPRNDSLTPPLQMQKMDSPDSEYDLKLMLTPIPTPTPTPTPTPAYSNNLENELVRVKIAHARELECLRLKLSATEAKVVQSKADAEREVLELQHRQSVTSDKHMADWEEALETERQRSNDLSWECDHLRRETDAARSYLKREADLIHQRDEHKRLAKEAQDTTANLTRRLHETHQETTRKEQQTASHLHNLAQQIQALERELNTLRSENNALATTSAHSTPSPRSDSPAPSLSSSQSTPASGAELRLANVRKTYITVKRRYDNLHSVAGNIATATRSWDCGSFGEFGQYLRQLKTVLDRDGEEGRGLVSGSQVGKVE